jgi:hypothetical protein
MSKFHYTFFNEYLLLLRQRASQHNIRTELLGHCVMQIGSPPPTIVAYCSTAQRSSKRESTFR